MANILANIEKTLPKVVDKVFAVDSLTERLIGNNEVKVDFVGARTVKVFKLNLSGLTPYVRGGHAGANVRGAVRSELETFTLSQERYIEIPLDKLDTLDDAETVLGVASREIIRTKVVPEFDAYRFSKLASYTSTTYGNRVVEDINANEIIKKFNEAFKWMSDNKVSAKDQVLYVSPEIMLKIRSTEELYKRLTQSEYKGEVSFTIEKYEGREIVEVPSDEFFTDIAIGEGYAPSSTSRAINFLLVDKKAPIIVKKLDFAKVFTSESGAYLGGFVGYIISNLYYHDLFVPENKIPAIYCSVSATVKGSDVANRLLAELAPSTANGRTMFVRANTIPQGLLIDSYYLATTANAPALGSEVSGLTPITIGTDFAPNATHNYVVGAYAGKVVAVSKDYGAGIPKGS